MKKWKAVFWIATILFAMQIINVPFSDSNAPSEVISLLINGFSLMPLYGFAYKVAIGSRAIAIAIFSINFFLIVASIYFIAIYTINNFSLLHLFISSMELFLILLFFYPMYAYAFTSKDIWNARKTKTSIV